VSDNLPARQYDVAELIRETLTNPDADPEKLRVLLEIEQSWDANEARKAFAADMVQFQGDCQIVLTLDKADKNDYAKLERIWQDTRELRKSCGLSVVWRVCVIDTERNTCHLEGDLIHRGGHSSPLIRTMPLPGQILNSSGKAVQNETQRAGSGESYCKRYALLSALGIVTGKDDDGGGETAMISVKHAKEIKQIISKGALPVQAHNGAIEWIKKHGGEVEHMTAKDASRLLPKLRKAKREVDNA